MKTEEKAKFITAAWGAKFIQFLAALAILRQDVFEENGELFIHIVLVQFFLFFISSWCNSSYSSYHPGAIPPILHIVLVKNSYSAEKN